MRNASSNLPENPGEKDIRFQGEKEEDGGYQI